MSTLPSATTPLNRHSLMAIETWFSQLGATPSEVDACRWILLMPKWSAEILMKQDELIVTWEENGQKSQCSFSYGLARIDIEAAIRQGP